MKYPIIPRRILISKRLAQCMHPDLPPGVHQKALETYDIIFKCMGTNRLSAELFIYSAGLFPLLPHAALNVRSALLTVYETHFVPLVFIIIYNHLIFYLTTYSRDLASRPASTGSSAACCPAWRRGASTTPGNAGL